ncbi:Hypothetical protein CINCED_3A003769 [Cinara cedri]|uniref:Pre-C2HC domain n=1 Tax=Cinara cedri TaxID=506608 RepID=A0A5E4NQI1_9HEMI|nr:Hypothetical protein CINCED_3A003769 [Cinara cedri]
MRILTTSESKFRSTIKILEENKVEYHRYQLKIEKPFRVVLRGINHDSDMGIITNELYDQGHELSKITNIQIKKKSDLKNKNSKWTYIRLPSFFTKAKCANCGENHTANWKGCSAYKKTIERVHPKQVSAMQRIQQKPVTANVSYVQIASTSKVDPKTSKPKGNEELITLNDILVELTNVTQTLANITAIMDKLEINQTKSKNTSQKIKK